MNELAVKILTTGLVEDLGGKMIPLHSNTSMAQAVFLEQQVRALKATTTLEIGLAYGISAMCIADTVKAEPNARCYVIDPFQNTPSWRGLGLKNLERAGLRSIVDFREDFAQVVLPQLVLEGVKIDFAYIDAGKRMDDILIFTHYLGRLLRVGGKIAFDDLAFPGIRKALRYLLQQSHFCLKASLQIQPQSISRRVASFCARQVPGGRSLFAPELLLSDSELGISANCVVIEKVAEPDEDWSWHPIY